MIRVGWTPSRLENPGVRDMARFAQDQKTQTRISREVARIRML
jgi:hypothetical protein